MEQGTPEWFAARLGKFTASCAKEWVLKKGEITDGARTYILKKLGEIKSGEPADSYVNEDMLHGQEQEPHARKWYTKLVGNEVEEVGFIQHQTLEYLGGSPDGKIVVDSVRGNLEIKCPAARNLHIHLKHCSITSPEVFKKVAPDYYWQCQTNMVCSGAEFCDFVSYFPFLADRTGFFWFRMQADPNAKALIEHSYAMCMNEMKRLAEILKIDFKPTVAA